MKLLLVDSNSVLNRAFYGIRPLTTKDGLMTNGIYGFLNILFKFLQEEKPDYIACAFDLKAPTFRHEQYAQYKAQRKGMPDELAAQLSPLKQLLFAMNIPVIEIAGFEADDIIGTLAHKLSQSGVDCVIVTGDRDDLQLINERTIVKLAVPKFGRTETTVYDEAKVLQEYGVVPRRLVDVKGLMGDASDNIPGVKGIGEKTALSLIARFESLEKLYDNINDAAIKDSVRSKLIEGREIAFLSRTLATICTDVPVPELESLKVRPFNRIELKKQLAELEMNSFISRLELDKDIEPALPDAESRGAAEQSSFKPQIEAESIENAADLEKFYGETTFITQKEDAFYILSRGRLYKACIDKDCEFLSRFFADENIKKAAFDSKAMIKRLKSLGIEPSGFVFDASLAGYIINPAASSYTPDVLAGAYLSGQAVDSETGGAFALSRLYEAMTGRIEQNGQHRLYYDIELPLAFVLADMEDAGFYVNRERLLVFGEKLQSEMAQTEGAIFELVGHSFNINSPKQLTAVLFDELGLPPVKKTKTGYSTDAEVLEKLKGTHAVIDLILEYRQLAKLKSTYVDGMLKVISEHDGRIHTSFNQTVTQTGRLSSTEPNLQNIPIRTEIGREIRRMFMAKPGHVLVDGDYSQIELRILAHMSGDENLIRAFNEGVDIHTLTASQVFGVPAEMVTSQMRSRAKAVNFGIMYGIGDFSLARDLKVTRSEAKAYIESYFARFPKVRAFLDGAVESAKEKGYAETLFARRRYIPELKSKNANERAFGQRVAMNSPIQGTAADIIKIAMVNVHRRLKREGLKTLLILQVHDELVLEAPASEAELAQRLLKEEMEAAVSLSVPMLAEVSVGESWYDAH